MNKKTWITAAITTFIISSPLFSMPEMVIGEAEMAPGIDLIFEGGIKDEITPQNLYLA